MSATPTKNELQLHDIYFNVVSIVNSSFCMESCPPFIGLKVCPLHTICTSRQGGNLLADKNAGVSSEGL